MAHVGHGALIGRGTYRAWHIHGGKVSLTYESSLIRNQFVRNYPPRPKN